MSIAPMDGWNKLLSSKLRRTQPSEIHSYVRFFTNSEINSYHCSETAASEYFCSKYSTIETLRLSLRRSNSFKNSDGFLSEISSTRITPGHSRNYLNSREMELSDQD